MPEKDGVARRAHLESAARQGDADAAAELEAAPALTPLIAPLWECFTELQAARTSSGFGANPLPYAEIDAWSRLTGTRLAPWEVRAIKQIDAVYLEQLNGKRKNDD